MTKTLEYFFTTISPYTYLAQPRVLELADKYDVNIVYKPFNIMTVFGEIGTLPPGKRHPSVQAYRLAELERWSKKLGLSMNMKPAHFPVPPVLSGALVLAAAKAGANPGPLTMGILRAVWSEDRDVSDPETLTALANEAGLDGAALVAAASSAEMQAALEATTQEAIDAGVFGSPFFKIDGELFWGQDRLDWIEEKLA